MLRMTAVPMGTFQILPLVLRNLPLHITAFFLNKMILEIKTFPIFSNFSTHLV